VLGKEPKVKREARDNFGIKRMEEGRCVTVFTVSNKSGEGDHPNHIVADLSKEWLQPTLAKLRDMDVDPNGFFKSFHMDHVFMPQSYIKDRFKSYIFEQGLRDVDCLLSSEGFFEFPCKVDLLSLVVELAS
jgi:hypothetical protein